MKTKPRARRMWANYYPHCPVPQTFDSKARAMSWAKDHPATVTVPVAVIPLHDVDVLIEQAYAAFQDGPGVAMKDSMRYALTAIGVLPRARKGRK
jgi:hypothetical protein